MTKRLPPLYKDLANLGSSKGEEVLSARISDPIEGILSLSDSKEPDIWEVEEPPGKVPMVKGALSHPELLLPSKLIS